MIRYFFVAIPSLLFEPAAVVALLGCITTLFFFHKKNNPFFCITLFAICLMFFWRLSLYSIMTSSRYAAVILYPAVIFDVLFCFHVKKFVQWFNLKFFHLNKSWFRILCTVLPYFLIFCLVVPCIAKTLRHNPYADYRIRLCKALAEEIRGKNFLLYAENDHLGQVAYYTGLDMNVPMSLMDNIDNSVYDSLKRKVEKNKNYMGNVYFVFPQKKGEPEPDAQHLGINPETGRWECIYRGYISRRKNKELVLYRFTPTHPNIEIWDKKIPDISPANLCRNGDFEQFLSPKEREQRFAYYKKIGASDFYLMPERLFPTQWWLGVGKPIDGHSSKMALTEKYPIAGKYSLELKSDRRYWWGINCSSISKQNCIFSGFIRTESESLVDIRLCYWNADKKKTDSIDTYLFRLQPGKTYRFSIPVRMNDFPKKCKHFIIIIQGQGHILLDNVECIRTQNTTGTEQKQ